MTTTNVNVRAIVAAAMFCLLARSANGAEDDETPVPARSDLNAISGWMHFKAAPDALYRYLSGQAYALLEQRNQRVKELKTSNEWKAQQVAVRQTLMDMVAPLPARTPLNARIVRTIEKSDYRIEHIIFESQPGFFVTSSLFLPRNAPQKAPVVLYCSGHSPSGYRGGYTRTILNLVKKGFIVFAWDPIGQGERLQYLSQSGKSILGVGTREHAYMTVQAMLTGSSLTRHVVWDGIRAVDYLLTRPEVDGARFGATGRSGGGFQSLYIPAFDDRIYATAPENHVTNSIRILQKIGPRDGEQNLFHMFARGIDHPDLLSVRAPKPTLIIATANDIFNIDGTRETVREAMIPYRVFGGGDNLILIEDIAGHQSTTQNNETMYAFFQKHLKNPGSAKTEAVELPSNDEMRVTETGQVGSAFKVETVPDLTRKTAEQLSAELRAAFNAGRLTPEQVVESAKRQTGYRSPNLEDRSVLTGSARREGYVVERYFLKGEGDYPIPYVLMVPAKPNGRAILYLHPQGKASEGGRGGEIEWLVNQGYKVLAPDLIGIGEVGPGDSSGEKDFVHRANTGVSYRTWYAGMFIGRSVLGVRASDVVKLSYVLKGEGATEVIGVARGALGPVLLHAAAFDDAITRVALLDAPASYRALATTTMYAPHFIETFVPGALRTYDLPYLTASLSPRPVLLHNPLDGGAQRMNEPTASIEYASTTAAYQSRGSLDRLRWNFGDEAKTALGKLLRD